MEFSAQDTVIQILGMLLDIRKVKKHSPSCLCFCYDFLNIFRYSFVVRCFIMYIFFRNFYLVCSYFLFFLTLPMGFFSAILRVLKAAAVGFFMLPRVDRCVMPDGFQKFDNGEYCAKMKLERLSPKRITCWILRRKLLVSEGLFFVFVFISFAIITIIPNTWFNTLTARWPPITEGPMTSFWN